MAWSVISTLPLDIDRDGDLDLIFSGFDNRHSMRKQQPIRANDGQRNLLFINEGGLKFREAPARNGSISQGTVM